MEENKTTPDSSDEKLHTHSPGDSDCWSHIGVSGDRSCPELNSHIHCRNCPVFAGAARTFFDRKAPEDYLADWSRWLSESSSVLKRGIESQDESQSVLSEGEFASVLIFRLGNEWLAFQLNL